MGRIILEHVSYCYKNYYEPIFQDVNMTIDTKWRSGLIGRNGKGKTTLLKIINGDFSTDSGEIIKNVATEIFPYENKCSYTNTLDVIKENIGGLKSMEEHLEDPEIVQQYLEAGGFEIESKIKKEMYLMKLPERLLYQDFDLLSGGEKTKIFMIILFLKQNTFILLDEPTNHLDIEGKKTIALYLRKKEGFIVVSHDRYFLDIVINHIISINNTNITIERGNYSSWKNNKDLRDQYELKTKLKLKREINQLERKAKEVRSWAKLGEKTKYAYRTNSRANGSKGYMKKAKDSETKINDKVDEKKSLLLNFDEAKALEIDQEKYEGEWLIKVKNLSFGYSDIKIISGIELTIYPGDRVWIKGKNGAGKSTLLKLLSNKIPNTSVEYMEDIVLTECYQEPLWNKGFVKELFMKQVSGERSYFEQFTRICEQFDLPKDFLERPLETYSSGERKKIDIARGLSISNQIMLLDEPLNYMDIYFREQFEKAILEYKPTMIFVEHDERFGENVATRCIEL